MRRTLSMFAVVPALALAGCGAGDNVERTSSKAGTEVAASPTSTPLSTPVATPTPKPRSTRPHRKKTPRPAPRTYVSCDANIEVKASTTTCALAQNTFYEYWYSWNYRELDAFAAYSASADKWLDMTCRGEARITCEATDGSVIRFPMSAVQGYNEEMASRYAAKATVSASPDDAAGEQSAEPEYDDGSGDAYDDGSGDAYDDVPYDRDCADFSESDFPTPPGDPDGLDADGDGIACES